MHDYSSEEESSDDLSSFGARWNPNSMLDELKKQTHEEEKTILKTQILDKFFNSSRPLLTSRMIDFILEPGSVENVMGFVTRLGPTNNNNNALHPLKHRGVGVPGKDDEIMRKSFNVVDLFVNPSNDLDLILSEKLHIILNSLFQIFRPESNGNLYHFAKILEQLLIRAPVETTRFLLTDRLLWRMFDFLHEAPVCEALMAVFVVSMKQSETIQFYKSLVDAKLFDQFGERLYGKDPVHAPSVSEFLVRFVDKLCAFEMAGVLFFGMCRNSQFIDGLFEGALNKGGRFMESQQRANAELIRELIIKSGQKVFESPEYASPLTNMLSVIHDKLHQYATHHVTALCDRLVALDTDERAADVGSAPLKMSAYAVRRPFGILKYLLVSILAELVHVNHPEIIPRITPGCWKVMSTWFLEYSHNNIYHSEFFKMYHSAVLFNYHETLKVLLQENKFLSRMIEHYLSKDLSGCRGFLLMMLNLLRFSGQVVPLPPDNKSWLRHYLNSHDVWKQSQGVLKKDTLQQLHRYSDLPTDVIEEEEDESLVELGSEYALSLGFKETEPLMLPDTKSPAKKKKKKPKKKKKSNPTSPTNSQEISSSKEEESDEEEISQKIPGIVTGRTAAEISQKTPEASPSWWTDIVQNLEEEENKNKDETKVPMNDWWADMKKELEATENSEKKN